MTEIDKLIRHLFYCEFSIQETWAEIKNRYEDTVSLAYIQFRFREYDKEFNYWLDDQKDTMTINEEDLGFD